MRSPGGTTSNGNATAATRPARSPATISRTHTPKTTPVGPAANSRSSRSALPHPGTGSHPTCPACARDTSSNGSRAAPAAATAHPHAAHTRLGACPTANVTACAHTTGAASSCSRQVTVRTTP
ncbi:hypothetical protein [Streptomyces sp. NPDC057301]|uniref:hypothetical protein n=1 Tax=Streptomyces sp. NPDC057301 TaxID=3346093 RepID=UPI00362EB7F0